MIGTTAQIKLIHGTNGQGLSITTCNYCLYRMFLKKLLHGYVKLHNVGDLLQQQIRFNSKIFGNEHGRCNEG